MTSDELKELLEALLGTRIAVAEEERIERRRYALLQAAATIDAGGHTGSPAHTVVARAETLLKEIERRENES